MATKRTMFPAVNLKTDAGYRAYINHVKDLFTNTDTVNNRVTLTSDTGQVNVDTVTAPPNASFSGSGSSIYSGYNIYRFNDGTNILYFRLDYGVYSTNSANAWGEPMLKYTLGYGSNGSGSITDVIVTDKEMKGFAVFTAQQASRGNFYSYMSIREGFLSFCMNVGGRGDTVNVNGYSYESHCLILSKQVDSDCYLLLSCNNSSTTTQTATSRLRDLIGTVFEYGDVGELTFQDDILPPSLLGSSGVVGSDIYIQRVEVPGKNDIYVDQNLIGYFQGDFNYAAENVINVDGVDANFLFLTPSLRTTLPRSMNIAIRWE